MTKSSSHMTIFWRSALLEKTHEQIKSSWNMNFLLLSGRTSGEQNCFYELLRQSSYFKINWPCCRNLLSVKLKGREQGWATEMHYWLDYTCLVHGMLDLKALWHNNISSIYTYYYHVQSWIPRIYLKMCKQAKYEINTFYFN